MITLEQVKAELDTENETYDDLIQVMINSVESVWEQLTNKKWIEQEVKELFQEVQCGAVYLTGENVSRVYSVASGKDSALVITGANQNTVQTVGVNSTSLILFDGTNGETELKFTDYKTLGELAAQISTVENFSAYAYPGYSGMLSQYLVEVAGEFCDSTGTDLYVPGEFVAGVKWNPKIRQIQIPSNYVAPITVVYKCGYSTTTCPDWLRQILIRQTCHWYQQAVEKRWHVSSISLGDGGTISYGEQKGNLLSEFKDIAAKNKRFTI